MNVYSPQYLFTLIFIPAAARSLLQAGIAARLRIVAFFDEHTVTGSQEELFRHYDLP